MKFAIGLWLLVSLLFSTSGMEAMAAVTCAPRSSVNHTKRDGRQHNDGFVRDGLAQQ